MSGFILPDTAIKGISRQSHFPHKVTPCDALGLPFPIKLTDKEYILPAVVLGFVAYGLSIFTYIRAQKTLGASKTSAYYAVAPFIGAFLSFILLHESLTIVYLIALAVMIAETAFVVSDTLKQK